MSSLLRLKLFVFLSVWLLSFSAVYAGGTAETDKVYIKNCTAKVGDQINLPIYVSTKTGYSAFQFDIVLPEGLTPAKVGGKYVRLLDNQRWVDHIVSEGWIPEQNTLRAVVIDMANEQLAPGDDACLVVTVTVDKVGELNGKITKVHWSTGVFSEGGKNDGDGPNTQFTVTATKGYAESVSVNPKTVTLGTGGSCQLFANVLPTSASQSVTWMSTNTSVAVVNSAGKVTALSPGTATVMATTTDGTDLSASCTVTVLPRVESISLTKTSVEMFPGDKQLLVARISPSDADQNVTWTSSSPSVATVNEYGTVTARSAGTAQITASTVDGSSLSATCSVKVYAYSTSLTLNVHETVMHPGELSTLRATVYPSTSFQSVTWTSSNSQVASVDSEGRVTAYTAGTAIITATTADGTSLTDKCIVTVRPFAESVTLSAVDTVLYVGGRLSLKASVLPSSADQEVVWSSSSPAVATVSSDGVVTALSSGDVNVMARATDGSDVTAICHITCLNEFEMNSEGIVHIRGDKVMVVDFPVSLVNHSEVSAVQFDVQFPQLVDLEEAQGTFDVWIDESRKTRNHSVEVEKLAQRRYRILVSSPMAKSLYGSEGAFVHMNVRLSDDAVPGDNVVNFYNIVLSGPDEIDHSLPGFSSKLTVKYLLGDANGDTSVDVADYVSIANRILLRNPSPFFADAADVTEDSNINVADLVGVANIALNVREGGLRPKSPSTSRVLFGNLEARVNGDELEVSISSDISYAAFQMDVTLPAGISFKELCPGELCQGLEMSHSEFADGRLRILASSFSERVMDGGHGVLFRMKLSGSPTGDGASAIGNAVFSARDMSVWNPEGISFYIGETGIYEFNGKAHIYGTECGIVIDSPVSGVAQIALPNGLYRNVQVEAGHNIIPVERGNNVYIVRFNGQTAKIML